jgi:hypothetical protein
VLRHPPPPDDDEEEETRTRLRCNKGGDEGCHLELLASNIYMVYLQNLTPCVLKHRRK